MAGWRYSCNQHRCRVLVLQQPISGRQCGLSHIFRLQNQWVFYITTGRSGWGHTEVSTCILHSREQEGRKKKKKNKKTSRPLRGKGIDPVACTKCLHLTSQQVTYWNRAGRSPSGHQILEAPHVALGFGGTKGLERLDRDKEAPAASSEAWLKIFQTFSFYLNRENMLKCWCVILVCVCVCAHVRRLFRAPTSFKSISRFSVFFVQVKHSLQWNIPINVINIPCTCTHSHHSSGSGGQSSLCVCMSTWAGVLTTCG